MNRSVIVALQAIFLYLTLVGSTSAQVKVQRGLSRLNGTYEFVSEEIRTTKPTREVISRSAQEWRGMWLIHDGFFSSQLMKDKREKFFDRDDGDLGYESFAGTYVIDNDQVVFTQNYSLNPLYKGRPVVMKFRWKGKKLVFVQKLTPIIEDMREGTVTITLMKMRKRPVINWPPR